MKMFRNIIAVAIVSALLTGCGLYKKYESNATIPADAYGSTHDVTAAMKGSSIAQVSWREFFTDPLLQQLIDTALVRNTDINSARIAVLQSQEALKAAKLAYWPSLTFAPSGSLSKFGNYDGTKTYNLPLQFSMDIDAFGSLTNQKRRSEASVLLAQAQQEAVRANIISAVAQQYMLLQVLDKQLEILTKTDSLWKASLDTQKALWENGKIFSTAVNQQEASYLNVKTQVVDVKRNIRAIENSLCQLLALTPRQIVRSPWGSYSLPAKLETGVPAEMLLYRPDIRVADFAMAEAFYNTQTARAAFYPNISLNGVLGWTNDGGGIVVNPGKILLSAMASLTQPIFARGKLKANLKISQLTEEDLRQKYVQTVINAGNQVNEALADCQAAREKNAYYHRQVAVLGRAYVGTHELMDNGKASYLEVLTAQETLLSAQLNEAMNMYDAAEALIALYIALGGATH